MGFSQEERNIKNYVSFDYYTEVAVQIYWTWSDLQN